MYEPGSNPNSVEQDTFVTDSEILGVMQLQMKSQNCEQRSMNITLHLVNPVTWAVAFQYIDDFTLGKQNSRATESYFTSFLSVAVHFN